VAYIGTDQAVMDLPSFQLKGRGAGVLWRGWETYRQISNRNKALVAFDWLRTRLFGELKPLDSISFTPTQGDPRGLDPLQNDS
jgi:NADH dehydrogenase FAD-containing subunit